MRSKIRLSKSVVGEQEISALSRVILKDGYLGMGKEVRLFEQELQDFFGTKREVVCVNSGTAALHLALLSILKPGDEVLVQSLTFLSSFQAISGAGAVPVPCEIHSEEATIDLNDAAKRLTRRTKAIMPVHYASRVGDLDAIYKFAKKHKLRVIEDAAHAFGTLHHNKLVGTFGDIACFSFDGIKNITSGEGGAVITNDRKVAQFVKDARLLGVHKDTDRRYAGQRSWEFDVAHQGYRYHMSNLFAAVGRCQLKKFAGFKKKRQGLAKKYYQSLEGMPKIILFPNDYDQIVPHIFPVRVLNNKRNGLRRYLISRHIECGVHYLPNHLLTYYGKRHSALPITERIYEELLTLPLHPDLTDKEQRYIINQVKKFFNSV